MFCGTTGERVNEKMKTLYAAKPRRRIFAAVDYRIAVRLALAACLTLGVLATTACPTQDQLTSAAKASTELAHDCDLATDIIVSFYNNKVIDLAKKDALLTQLRKVAVNGQKFHGVLGELDKKYPEGSKMPESEVQFIRENWKIVSEPFWGLWTELNLFGGASAVKELRGDVDTIEKVLK